MSLGLITEVGPTSFLDVESSVASIREEADRGSAFESIAARFLERDPVLDLVRVWAWRDWPGRLLHGFGPDDGIDLVGEDRDGLLVAVQVKFVLDPADRTPFGRLATFTTLLSAHDSPFARGYLLTNATGISSKVRRYVVEGHRVRLLLRDALLDSPIDWSPVPPAVPPAPTERRPDQAAAVADVVRVLREEPRTRLIAACGTGKTLMAFWTARELEAERILVLLPSLALVRQFRAVWADQARRVDWHPRIHAICSEGEREYPDEARVLLAELGIPSVSTDPTEIGAWLRASGPQLVFTTYQSSPRLAEAMKDEAVPGFDLAVADEAHHVATGLTASPFRTILDGAAIRADRRLFMTATERIFAPAARRRAERDGLEIASMDDESQFGPVGHRITFGKAIADGRITDYRIVVSEIVADDPAVESFRESIEERRFVDAGLPITTDAETLASAIALTRAAREFGFTRTVSFHHRATKGAAPFAELVAHLEPSWRVAFVSGEQSTAEREAVLAAVLDLADGDRALITNARCLGEGIDLPDLEAVAFVDPKSSVIEIVQAAARAMRLPKAISKPVGWIVVPVVVPAGQSVEEAMAGSAYERVWEVVASLRAHDERLAETIDDLRAGAGKRHAARARFLEDHLARAGSASQRIDLADWRARIGVRIVEEAYDGWASGLLALQKFVEREGHARVPVRHLEGPFRLGTWVANKRQLQRRGVLDRPRAALLEELPGWTWEPFEVDWERGLAALRRFVEREHTARVPLKHVEQGFNLGAWVGSRRRDRRLGRLDLERVEVLEAFTGWTWDPAEDDWLDGLTALKSFVAREGHARVPQRCVEGEIRLGVWVANRRRNREREELDEQKVQILEQLPGWVWDPLSEQWDRAYQALRSFVERHGTCVVPEGHREDGLELRVWMSRQRRLKKDGKLDPSKISLLEAISGWEWAPQASPRPRALIALQRFVQEHGHALVPTNAVIDDVELGRWVSRQRELKRKGQLPQNERNELEAFPGWSWDPTPERSAHTWNTGLAALRAYVLREGRTTVSVAHVEHGMSLFQWMARVRGQRRQGRLSEAQISELEAIPGWTWDPYEDAFRAGAAAVRTFIEENGHSRVPYGLRVGALALGTWVATQRRLRRTGKLAQDRVNALESISGWEW